MNDDTFQKLLEIKYRWPKRGDRVAQHQSKFSDVYIPESVTERSSLIWSGYFRAGTALIEKCENETHEQAFLIYPIMFSYRHALEVALKYMIDEYGCLANIVPPEDKSHNLLDLWKLHEQLCERFAHGADIEATAAVRRIVLDFHELDTGAFAFRYATNAKGAVIELPSGVVSLATLKDVMEGVANFFDGSDGYYADLKSNIPISY